MVRYHIKATESSPEVNFDLYQGVLEFSGPSCLARSECFYGKLMHHAWDLNKRLYYHNLKIRLSFTSICKANSDALAEFLVGISKLQSVSSIWVEWIFPAHDEELKYAGQRLNSSLESAQISSLQMVAM